MPIASDEEVTDREVAQRLLESYRVLGKQDEGLTLLRGFLASSPSLDLLDVAFQSTLEAQGAEAAHRLVRDEFAPSWWTLADAAGNEADIATTTGRP